MELVSKLKNVVIKKDKLEKLKAKFNISENLIKLLYSRNIKTEEEINNFLNPSISSLYNPFGLSGMQQLVNRINLAIKNQEKVVIVGDYDTDGICATTILLKYFFSKNFFVEYFLPNRFSDGYSLTMETVNKIKATYNPSLIITVDCGISCAQEVEYAKTLGIDIIITDHHEIPETIPNTIVVDPKLESNNYPFKELCGAGVALKVVQALGGLQEALKYANIASLATVADIVPLINENRAIVHIGLSSQNELPLGIKKLIKACGIINLTASDIAFKLAPKINTAGRLKDANLALNLFLENDNKKLEEYLSELLKLNDERIEKCNKITDEAFEMISKINVSEKRIIVLAKDNWDSGVLGIVCSKIVEKLNKPVCLLGKCQNEFKGSLRSIENVDIFKALTAVKHLTIRFGGHSQAGGLSITENNIVEFEKELQKYLFETYTDENFLSTKYYDLDFGKQEITKDFLKELKMLEPCGFGNEKPTVKVVLNNKKVTRMKNYYNHIKTEINGMEVLGFNMGEYYEQINSNCQTELVLDIMEDTYAGKTKIKGFIKLVKCNFALGAVKQEISLASVISTAQSEGFKYSAKNINLENFSKENSNNLFGTLFVTSSYENYATANKICGNIIKNYEIYSVINESGVNTLLYVPLFNLIKNKNFKNFKNIVFLENPTNLNFLSEFSGKNVYLAGLNNKPNFSLVLSTRENIINVFNAIKMVQGQEFNSVFDCFYKLTKQTGLKCKFCDFVFAINVLNELKIVEISLNGFSLGLTDVKNNLENSNLFKTFSAMN